MDTQGIVKCAQGLKTLFSAAVLTVAIAASATAADKKYTIGYDNYFMGNSWSVQLAAEFKAEAEKGGPGAVFFPFLAHTLTVAPTTGAFAGMPAARGHALQVRGGPGGKAPASVAVNGVTVPPGRGVPGFYVAADAANALTEPPGTLVVNAGPGFPLDAPVEVAVTW